MQEGGAVFPLLVVSYCWRAQGRRRSSRAMHVERGSCQICEVENLNVMLCQADSHMQVRDHMRVCTKPKANVGGHATNKSDRTDGCVEPSLLGITRTPYGSNNAVHCQECCSAHDHQIMGVLLDNLPTSFSLAYQSKCLKKAPTEAREQNRAMTLPNSHNERASRGKRFGLSSRKYVLYTKYILRVIDRKKVWMGRYTR